MKEKDYLVRISYSNYKEYLLANGTSKEDVYSKCRYLFGRKNKNIRSISCKRVIVNPVTGSFRFCNKKKG